MIDYDDGNDVMVMVFIFVCSLCLSLSLARRRSFFGVDTAHTELSLCKTVVAGIYCRFKSIFDIGFKVWTV